MRVLLAIAAVTCLAATISSARADEWCGFIDKAGAPVRCGFSSASECKQALGDKKDAYCMPDPTFAGNDHAGAVRLAASRF
jgi:hypothetical protein